MASTTPGILLEIQVELVGAVAVHDAAHLGVAELAFCLAFELGFHDLDREDGGEALEHVVHRERLVQFLLILGLLEELVDGPGQRVAESGEVGSALLRVDAVDVGVDHLVEAVVVLDADFDLDIVARAVEVDDILV